MSKPFLRWVGGKRWLVPALAPLIRENLVRCYIEPFLGGGSMFFGVQPQMASIGDLNQDLINAYSRVYLHPDRIERLVSKIEVNEANFYAVRASKPVDLDERAARMIYLNRTCFNGIYRSNQRGEFNVPYGGGRDASAILGTGVFREASKVLDRAKIVCGDFEKLIEKSEAGDVVYCDPAYTVAHADNGFLRYNESVFSWTDQKRLASACFASAARGSIVLVSNADHASVRKLYHPYQPIVVFRGSMVGAKFRQSRITENLFVLGGHRKFRSALLSSLIANGVA